MTMAESSSEPKRQKSEEGADMISALPNSLLYHILSFVPTKTSVATSVLSRRWRDLWKHLQVFDFTDNSHEFYDATGELFKRFAVFVNSVMILREARDVHRFRLVCGHSRSDPFHDGSVTAWIRAVTGPHLKQLRLTLFSIDGHGFMVPHNLFDCTNIETLILCGGIHMHLQWPPSIKFSSLKKLHLDINSVESIDALLARCPNLETLFLSFGPRQPVKVHMPSTLKKLEFTVESKVNVELEIHAPCLEYLSITQYASAKRFNCTVVGNMNNVVKAYLNVHPTEEPIDTLLRLLTAVCRTESLTLWRLTTKWLLQGPILDLPDFRYLVNLELVVPWFNSSFLVNLLQKCHKLRNLNLQIDKNCQEQPPTLSQSWTQPTIVPSCLASQLSCLYIIGYQGHEDELAFVGYIMRRGFVLRRVLIYSDANMDIQRKYQILKELFAIPRGSRSCQTRFY